MLALTYHRSVPAFALVRASGGNPEVATSALSMLHLGDVPEPELPAAGWMRVLPSLSGICGSDLAAIGGHASLYLDPLTSYPFVPGHEVVGVLEDGSRVVIGRALGCVVRGIEPVCPRCAEGRPGLCYNATEGPIEVGLQTGYCASTGGGWGEVLVAHPSQVHAVPAALTDEAAALIEPFACCVHAALRGGASKSDVVVVVGAGTIGLLTVAAVKMFTPPKRLIAVAKHPTQRDLALALGADAVIAPADAFQRIRFATAARRLDGVDRSLLLGGADITFECVGRADSLSDAVRFTREGGGDTPPTRFRYGEGVRLGRLPLGSRIVYPPDPLEPIAHPERAIKRALGKPLDDDPLKSLLRRGMKLTLAFDDLSLPLPPMAAPDVRQLVMEEVIDMAAEAGVEDIHGIAALGLHRPMP